MIGVGNNFRNSTLTLQDDAPKEQFERPDHHPSESPPPGRHPLQAQKQLSNFLAVNKSNDPK